MQTENSSFREPLNSEKITILAMVGGEGEEDEDDGDDGLTTTLGAIETVERDSRAMAFLIFWKINLSSLLISMFLKWVGCMLSGCF